MDPRRVAALATLLTKVVNCRRHSLQHCCGWLNGSNRAGFPTYSLDAKIKTNLEFLNLQLPTVALSEKISTTNCLSIGSCQHKLLSCSLPSLEEVVNGGNIRRCLHPVRLQRLRLLCAVHIGTHRSGPHRHTSVRSTSAHIGCASLQSPPKPIRRIRKSGEMSRLQ